MLSLVFVRLKHAIKCEEWSYRVVVHLWVNPALKILGGGAHMLLRYNCKLKLSWALDVYREKVANTLPHFTDCLSDAIFTDNTKKYSMSYAAA